MKDAMFEAARQRKRVKLRDFIALNTGISFAVLTQAKTFLKRVRENWLKPGPGHDEEAHLEGDEEDSYSSYSLPQKQQPQQRSGRQRHPISTYTTPKNHEHTTVTASATATATATEALVSTVAKGLHSSSQRASALRSRVQKDMLRVCGSRKGSEFHALEIILYPPEESSVEEKGTGSNGSNGSNGNGKSDKRTVSLSATANRIRGGASSKVERRHRLHQQHSDTGWEARLANVRVALLVSTAIGM